MIEHQLPWDHYLPLEADAVAGLRLDKDSFYLMRTLLRVFSVVFSGVTALRRYG
jgi:hypothetical protein